MANDNNVTALFNRSLSYLGERKITSANAPETTAGRRLVDCYDMCRREILRRVSWNFAECWASLDYFAPAPTGFDYQDTYQLPADYIRIIDIPGLSNQTAVFGAVRSVEEYRFITMDGAKLIALSNNAATTLAIAYIADVTNLTLWDPLALKCLATWMALDIAKGVTGQDTLVQQLNQMLNLDLQDAVGVNGNEQRKRRQTFSNVQKDRQNAFLGEGGFFTPVSGYNT